MQAPGPPPHPQMLADAEHLKALSICHYVMGAMAVVFGSFPIFHVLLGGMIVTGKMPTAPVTTGGSASFFFPHEAGWFFIIFGAGLILLSWTYGVLMFFAGRSLGRRRNRTFCFVMACLSCVHVPLGTVLGVFTLLVLMRPTVQALFEGPPPGSLPQGGYLNR